MSFCPHRLLRSRFRAGLPACFPPPSLRLEQSYRLRGTVHFARYVANNASPSHIAHPGELSTELRLAYEHHSTTQTTTSGLTPDLNRNLDLDDLAFDEDEPLDSLSPKPYDDYDSEIYETAPGVVHTEARKIVYFDRDRDGKILGKRTRRVSKELAKQDDDIRLSSLFSRADLLHRWRNARNEIYQARFLKRAIRKELVTVRLNYNDRTLLRMVKEDKNGFRDKWEALPKSARAAHWFRLSLWILQHDPECLPQFLLLTCQSAEKPPFMPVSDCVLFLNQFYPETVQGETFLHTCLSPHTWPILFLPQKGVRHYLKSVGRNLVYEAYRVSRDKRIHLKAETCLCFMGRFIEFGDVEKAIEMLSLVRTFEQDNLTMDSEPVLRHCCSLLMRDTVQNSNGQRNFGILPQLLEMGVRPNQEMMNIVLSNALKTGDPQVGLDMLDFMRGQNFHPDSYTYVALLTDALARDDRARFDELRQEIESHGGFQKNPWILSKVLHYHFMYTAKNIDPNADPKEIFVSMLDVYTKAHDITPLKELSIVPPNYSPPSGIDKSPPSVVALYIIITAYLRCQKHLNSSKLVYSRFRHLALNGHPTIAPLAATDHMYNEFLVSFRSDPRGLQPAVQLVEDMLHSSSKAQADPNSLPPNGIIHPAPSVRTWTLLMSIFVYNHQPLAAEKVGMMMAKHGVKYNQVTWNTLINGFTNTQDYSTIAKHVKEMERQGFVINDYLLKSLRYLRDPERLWVAIEELDGLSSPDPENSLNRSAQASDTEMLLDEGLQRLKENMKTKQ